ncbi:MAG TPA: hypothetical protein VLE02_01475 [Nitrosarchaeum sp.]|nr:hypothetical protein [Nitrosarchaeum sp.]
MSSSKYPECGGCVDCGGGIIDFIFPGENVIVDNTGNEVTVSASVFEVEQPGNTFTIGTALYFDGAVWQLAQSTSFATSGTHIVSREGDPTFRVTSDGVVDLGIPHGFPAGSVLYVDPDSPGNFTTTNPTAPFFSNPIAKVLSGEIIEVFSYRSEIGLPPSTIFLNPAAGSDSNSGLTSLTPVLTLQGAISKFGTNTKGPSNRTANIIIAAGTLNLGASPVVDITPLANIGFSQLIIIGNTTTVRSGVVVGSSATNPSQQFSFLGTDQVGMGVNAFRGMVMINNSNNTDCVIESNTATTITIPDGRGGDMIGFNGSDTFSIITHNTTLTWASGSVTVISTKSIQLKLRYMIILAAGAVTDTIRFRLPSGSADNGAVLVTVTGCSLTPLSHTAMFTGYEMNFAGCLVNGLGLVTSNSADYIARYVRIFITNGIIVPVNGISGGIYAVSQTESLFFQEGASVFGCKIENLAGATLGMIQIINANIRAQGIQILGSLVLNAFGILISGSIANMTGIDINGNNRIGRGMGVTRGSTCRIGYIAGLPNDFAFNRSDGIIVSDGSQLDTGSGSVLTSTVANGIGAFGVALTGGSTFTFALTPTITGAGGDCGLGASGARTWAQVAGGLAANVNDFGAVSPQNVMANSAP